MTPLPRKGGVEGTRGRFAIELGIGRDYKNYLVTYLIVFTR